MNMILPVKATAFSTGRAPYKGERRGPVGQTLADMTEQGDAVSLKINGPLANMAMLLEILSEAGDAANGNETATPYDFKRRRDDHRDRAGGWNQYSFDFKE